MYDFKNNTIVFNTASYTSAVGFDGLFKIIKAGVTIKNLKISVMTNDLNITSGFLLADRSNTELEPITINNCSLILTLASATVQTGLIGDYFTGTVDHCTMDYTGSVVPKLTRIGLGNEKGWILGNNAGHNSSLTVTNCSSNGDVAEGCCCLIGPFCGWAANSNALVLIDNCTVSGSMDSNTGGGIGRILASAGFTSNVTIKNCTSSIISLGDNNAGICDGATASGVDSVCILTIENCIFNGQLGSSANSGGIIRQSDDIPYGGV